MCTELTPKKGNGKRVGDISGKFFFFVGLQSASVSDRLLLCDEFPRDRFVPMTGKGSFGRALLIGGQKINPKHSHVKPAASKSTVAER